MLGGLTIALLSLLVLNGVMYLLQPQMTFFPSPVLEATPADWGMVYEDVVFQTEDGASLHGWFLPGPASGPTLLFLHGNAGNISHRRESLEIFAGLGMAVLIFDYRGYGRSTGLPGESGLYRDAAAAWDYLTRQRGIDSADIVVFGRSLGGAVAAHLASQVHPRAVILESTFSSARDYAHTMFPVLSRIVWLRHSFDAAHAIAQSRAPLLVLHSPEDEVIPFALGQRLFDAAPEPKRFVALRGGHNDGFLFSQPRYAQVLQTFLRDLHAAKR
ncbi:MAG: alpha/beta hydrolase [Chromatiaceae bacterium]|nr:alpha/beta hydrolase [Chromatiaceae bacterium]MCP5312509.1 alpha/beta hydrolase [Chromatiaceae bacterium]